MPSVNKQAIREEFDQLKEKFKHLPRYGGTVIHDCWQSYLSYDNCDHVDTKILLSLIISAKSQNKD